MIKPLVSLILSCSVGEVFATNSLEPPYRCDEALHGVSRGPNYALGGEMLFEPHPVDPHKGFYLLGSKMIYFCSFSPKPAAASYQNDIYNLKVKVGSEALEYLTVSVFRDDVKRTSVVSLAVPSPGAVYQSDSCREDLTAESRAKLAEILKSRIQTVSNIHQRHLTGAKILGNTETPDRAIAALKLCREVPELAEASERELAKFPGASGARPAVTSLAPAQQ